MVFEQKSDGTATLTGEAVNPHGHAVPINITFTGGTTTPPAGSPKSHTCLHAHTSGWGYYTNFTGHIGGMGITKASPAFQVGYGANNRSNTLGFGASAWFHITSGNNFWKNGDLNIMLNPTCTPRVTCEPLTHPGSIVGGGKFCSSIPNGQDMRAHPVSGGCGEVEYLWQYRIKSACGAAWSGWNNLQKVVKNKV